MASLLIATPFLHSDTLRRRAGMSGFQGQKTSRVSCQATAGDEVTVRHTLSSPLLKLTSSDLIAAYLEEATHEGASAGQQVPVAAETATRRSARVIFTDEKARLLRKGNRATSTFHDKWYYSAIASRLATPE